MAPHTARVPLDIFLVDDSPTVRERIEGLLARLDGACVVGRAAGADEAIRRILALLPQVVLLDLRLAQGSGFDVLRAVCPQAPQIDVFVLSNFATPAYRRTAEQLGARAFFDKTQEFGQLLERLAALARGA
jgi:DNA-binding NarL/FixJ family response regulator